MRRLSLLGGLVIVLPAVVSLAAAPPKDLSADMVILDGTSTLETMRINISGARTRLESQMIGGFVSIVRRDRGIVWTLYPTKKQYTERPLDAKAAAQDMAADPPGVISKVKTGTSSVAGYACTNYRMVIAGPAGRNITSTTCFADALGLAVRMETSGIVSELRNIRLGGQPGHLFEIPAGFRLSTSQIPPTMQMPGRLPRIPRRFR